MIKTLDRNIFYDIICVGVAIVLTYNDMVVIIDMSNGFVYEGALASHNVASLVHRMSGFVEQCLDEGIEVWHYVDAHNKNAKEFSVYPKHCVAGTYESKVIPELDFAEIYVVKKNSTNGFLAKNPFSQKKNLNIIGCVTDICVYDFAYTAIKYVHEHNLNLKVRVIDNLCATFDAEGHDSKEVHKATLEKLKKEGVEILHLREKEDVIR